MRQTFDHDTPSAPALTLGMLLGASGVTHPALQTLGTLAAAGAGAGALNDSLGYGQFDYDEDGYLYIGDTQNNRVRRAVLTNGAWTFDTDFTSAGTVLGGGTDPCNIAIDRTVTPNQIHIAARSHFVTGTWISVWSVADWPNLTALNRIRQYGSNASSGTADHACYGQSLTIDGTYACVASSFASHRLLRWNHLTGALQNQITQTAAGSGFVTDGAGTWWLANSNANTIKGLHEIDETGFTSVARLDTINSGALTTRYGQFWQSVPYNPVLYGTRIYVRDQLGRVHGFDTSTRVSVDDFALSGGLGASDTLTGANGHTTTQTTHGSKSGLVVDPLGCAWYVAWCANAAGTASQSFLMLFPMSASVATWTKTDWSSGTNTIKAISLKGTNLSGEKYKLRLKKNAGAWTTVTQDLVQDEATLDWETFTAGDTLTVELSLSTWDRLDGHATLAATRDKLSPSEVAVQLVYEDTVADVYVPYATAGFKARQNATGAFKARHGE
jgi:hypothetical protein